jgi:hypothetical protein
MAPGRSRGDHHPTSGCRRLMRRSDGPEPHDTRASLAIAAIFRRHVGRGWVRLGSNSRCPAPSLTHSVRVQRWVRRRRNIHESIPQQDTSFPSQTFERVRDQGRCDILSSGRLGRYAVGLFVSREPYLERPTATYPAMPEREACQRESDNQCHSSEPRAQRSDRPQGLSVGRQKSIEIRRHAVSPPNRSWSHRSIDTHCNCASVSDLITRRRWATGGCGGATESATPRTPAPAANHPGSRRGWAMEGPISPVIAPSLIYSDRAQRCVRQREIQKMHETPCNFGFPRCEHPVETSER